MNRIYKEDEEQDAVALFRLSPAEKEKVWKYFDREIPMSDCAIPTPAQKAILARHRKKMGRPKFGPESSRRKWRGDSGIPEGLPWRTRFGQMPHCVTTRPPRRTLRDGTSGA